MCLKMATAKPRLIAGCSEWGLGHAVLELGVPSPICIVGWLRATSVSQWNRAPEAMGASRSSADQRQAVDVLARRRTSAAKLGCAEELLPSLGPRAECFSHPSRIMAGDGPASFRSEEQHTWQLFTVLQYILWISLLIRVFLDNFFALTSCFADQRTQKSARWKTAGRPWRVLPRLVIATLLAGQVSAEIATGCFDPSSSCVRSALLSPPPLLSEMLPLPC